MIRRSRSRLALAAAAVTLLGLTGSAIAAGIDVPETAAGQGSEAVVGFEVVEGSLDYATNLHEVDHGDVRVGQVQLQLQAVDANGDNDGGYNRPTRAFVAVLAPGEGDYTATYYQCTQAGQADGLTTFTEGLSAITVCDITGDQPLLGEVVEVDVVAYQDTAQLPPP